MKKELKEYLLNNHPIVTLENGKEYKIEELIIKAEKSDNESVHILSTYLLSLASSLMKNDENQDIVIMISDFVKKIAK